MSFTPGRIHIAIVLLLLAFLAVFSGVQESTTHVVVMHTNDLHGQLLPRGSTGGLAEIASIVRNVQPDILVDAGDMFTGTPVCDQFLGRPIIEVMSRIGYRAAALGNHEFDYGIDELRDRVREAGFSVLSANVHTGIDGIGQTTVLEVQDLRIGIIGLTTARLAEVTHPRNLTNVRTEDVLTAVERVLPTVRARSDFVMIVAHIEDEEERRIAEAFPEIRLIIGGHNHGVLGPIQIGSTVVAKTGSSGRNLGRVDLQFRGRSLEEISATLIPVRGVRPDPEIAGIIQPYQEQVSRVMDTVIAQATGEIPYSRDSESPLANIIADAFRAKTGTDIALHNVGGIRAGIRQGPVTRGDLFETVPFNNTLVTMLLSGLELKRVLGRSLLAVSGLRIEYAPDRGQGQRLISAMRDNRTPLLDDQLYSVTTNDFLVAGGDGFIELSQGSNIEDTGISIQEAVEEYVASLGSIEPITDGRIRISR